MRSAERDRDWTRRNGLWVPERRPFAARGLGLGLGLSRASVSVGWTPAQLSPALWLDSAAAVNSSGKVASWPDWSSHGNNATQSTSSLYPTYLSNAQNGLPAVETVASSSTLLTTGNLAIGSATEVTLLLACAGGTMPGSSSIMIELGNASQTPYFSLRLDEFGNSEINFVIANTGSNYTIDYFVPGASFASPFLLSAILNIGTSTSPRSSVQYNEIAKTLTTITGGTPAVGSFTSYPLNIGARSGGTAGVSVKFLSIVVLPAAITNTQLTTWYGYALDRWNFT